MNSAADILGTSRKTISTVMNYIDTFVRTPKLGVKCQFIEPHLPLKSGNPYTYPYMLPDLAGVDYTKLPLDRIYAFTESFDLHSDYASSSEAARLCGFEDKYYQVSRYINKRFVACVIGGLTVNLLFAQNPLVKGGRNPVMCLDTSDPHNIPVRHKSIAECAKAVGTTNNDTSNLIKNYVRTGAKYKGKYLITYALS